MMAVMLSGCGTIKPTPLTQDEITARVNQDRAAMYQGQEPLNGPLTLSDAMARALKYNLDYRLKMMETTLARTQLDLSSQDMLPKLMADAGYRWRNNDSGGTSVGIDDRVVSLRPSTSEEREHYLADATFSWDVLDFGMSYFRARQQADEVNIAEERRRKVLQNIVQEVRDAYWRALGAQRLLAETTPLADQIASALEKTREAEQAGILPPVEGLEYQRALLDAITMLNQKRQQMEMAKSELRALINAPPGSNLVLDDKPLPLSAVPQNIDKLEQMALERRPELREEDYKTRIDSYETRRQIASLLPNLNLFAGVNYDSNEYLYNNNWVQGGVGVSMNLFKLLSIPAISANNDARTQTDNARRMALSMAVLTQVRVALERYKLAVYDFQIADQSAQVDQRLASISKAGSDNSLTSDLETLRTQARSIVSRFQMAGSYAEAQAAYGRVLNSVGIDLLPAQVSRTDVASLSREISASLRREEQNVFTTTQTAVVSSQAIRVEIERVPGGVSRAGIERAVSEVLAANQMTLSDAPQSLRLQMRFTTLSSSTARKGQWTMVLVDRDDNVRLSRQYQSYLPDDVSTRTLSALAQAAALSATDDIQRISGAGMQPLTLP
ncbi:TolC family protein [Enterobacter hormaechei]|uniref:TolC family protein n=1 Tax=Enterobacter cloacae complex TaxID=354276 RepID=UPI001EDBEF29|nr:TolC family protein [Enterobacter hormaechei]MDO2398887.1 TolC family protein [Enterobacter hormaechei]MDO2404110.1 TolC family protein [Enterobacter hormaechei]MDO2418623.1 TolC family protein [Enterobacter hormaechei]MDO2426251.1 TolC family protein [Enterobacter hormaechei]